VNESLIIFQCLPAAVTVPMKDKSALKTKLNNRINRYYTHEALGVGVIATTLLQHIKEALNKSNNGYTNDLNKKIRIT